MIIKSIIVERPTEKEGRFWPFCPGAIAYSLLLLLIWTIDALVCYLTKTFHRDIKKL